jgi:hypothetical protein
MAELAGSGPGTPADIADTIAEGPAVKVAAAARAGFAAAAESAGSGAAGLYRAVPAAGG